MSFYSYKESHKSGGGDLQDALLEISDRWVAEKQRNLYYRGGLECYLLEDIAFALVE